MMDDPALLLIGAGGHAKVVMDVIRAAGQWRIAGVIAGGPAIDFGSVRVIGTDADLPALRHRVPAAFVAVGDNVRRHELLEQLLELGYELPSATHPRATIAPSVRIGRGVIVMAGAVINADSTVEDGAIVNTSASVDHDCFIGVAAHIAPGAHLSGYVHVGARALIGIGATVGRGRQTVVGEDSIVGAGSVVINEVPPGHTVFGVPARVRP